MEKFEVICKKCGEYFTLETDMPELTEIFGICPNCGYEDEHEKTEGDY